MSKPKNRLYRKSDGLVHSTHRGPRRNNYFVVRCDASISYSPTDESIPLTCLVCWGKENQP